MKNQPSAPLENLSGQGKPLQAEPPDAKEIAGLVKSGLARLKDAQNTNLITTTQAVANAISS